MIYKQLTSFPIIFQVDENIYDKVDVFLKKNNLHFKNVLIVSGKKHSLQFSKVLSNKFNYSNFILEDNAYSDVEFLKKKCLEKNTDLIISIGGGKVQDSVKRVSYLININHISIPTIISNDGLISPVSVIKNNISKNTESIAGIMPMGVIIDLNIIDQAPIKYIRAAAGDILSNLSATNDWILSKENNNDIINDISFLMSKSAANSLIYFSKKDFKFKPFLRQIIQGQINSGIAMSLAGSSRPCSGSEHLISHAIDSLGLGKHILHGEQVASISIFVLFLQGKLIDDYLKYALETKIELNFTKNLKVCNSDVLQQIFKKSKIMRPGRYTILDILTEKLFITKVFEFEELINKIPFNNKNPDRFI